MIVVQERKATNATKSFVICTLSAIVGTIIGGVVVFYYTTGHIPSISNLVNQFSVKSGITIFETTISTDNDPLPVYRKFPTIPNFGAINGYTSDILGLVRSVDFFDHVYFYRYSIPKSQENAIDNYIRILKDSNFAHLTTLLDEYENLAYVVYVNPYSKFSVALGHDSRGNFNVLTGEESISFVVYVLESDHLGAQLTATPTEEFATSGFVVEDPDAPLPLTNTVDSDAPISPL